MSQLDEPVVATVPTGIRRATAQGRAREIGRRVLFQREIGVVTALVLLCLYGSFGTDGFAAKTNLLNVGQQVSLIGIMAIGMTFVIVSGEIDLSVGSTYALASTVTGLLIEHGHSWILAVVAGLLAGAACGLVNGLVTVGLGLPSFIVTLGTLSVIRGIALLTTNAAPITLDQTVDNVSKFSYLGEGRPLGIPMQLVIMLVLVAAGGFLLRYTRFGFRVYAVGGSREAARLCGIPVAAVRVASFVIAGTFSALAGILGLSFLLYSQGTTGTGLELLVITAVIIGGAALFGGSGTMVGTLVGVFLIGALQNILVLANVSSFWQTIVIGVVIVASVALDTWVRRRSGGA